MEMLNSANLFLKTDLWTILIDVVFKWLGNYGWAIILFTVLLKLVLTPLDVLQRKQSAKQSKVMAIMQPEINALQQKYGNDREKINQETAKLYKKYNVNLGGMCLPLLLSLGISMLVFLTLFGSLKDVGTEKLYASYSRLDNAYQTAYTQAVNDSKTGDDLTNYVATEVQTEYDKLKTENSWLWVKNVWKGDTSTSQFVDFSKYAEYKNFDNQTIVSDGKTEYQLAEQRYNIITSTVSTGNDQNGYYILIIASAVVSFLAQFISTLIMTPKGQKLNSMNKVMFVVIPVSMLIFTIKSNVVFSLYVVVNSIMTTIISTSISLIMKSKNKSTGGDIELPKKNVEVVEYSRNYRK